ncbi:uncharacterized protein LOC135502539 [Lineus longissimus]|uniref:uncharacterized protein LOC135502539 n=1 Tax=Lineus longissimus TaxID=88925 RepID=UPI00315D9CBC
MDMAALSDDERDLVLVGMISSLSTFSEETQRPRQKVNTKRKHQWTRYMLQGVRVCRSTFIFVHKSLNTLDSNIKWYKENGISIRKKKRGGRHKTNKRYLTYDDIQKVVQFLSNFAEANNIILPGRHPCQKNLFEVKLLPSHVTKAEVYRLYRTAMRETGLRSVKLSTFRKLWKELLPKIIRTKPMTDLCAVCQSNNYAVFRSANLSEADKSDRLRQQEVHLVTVSKAREYYKGMVSNAKLICNELGVVKLQKSPPVSRAINMHYSFDYVQQVMFPNDPLQPGPMYFLVPRKCCVFGICCEALPQQINYLVDKGMNISKGSQSVINYLDYFFLNYGLGEYYADLHCDNCCSQNKNRHVLNYLAWRTIHKLHFKISLIFLITGHTKFAPDWCFGLFKQRFRRTRVNTLDDIANVVSQSTVSGVNIPQLAGKEDGSIIVPCKVAKFS